MSITNYVPVSTYHATTQVFDDAEATANLVRTALETLADNAKYLKDNLPRRTILGGTGAGTFGSTASTSYVSLAEITRQAAVLGETAKILFNFQWVTTGSGGKIWLYGGPTGAKVPLAFALAPAQTNTTGQGTIISVNINITAPLLDGANFPVWLMAKVDTGTIEVVEPYSFILELSKL